MQSKNCDTCCCKPQVVAKFPLGSMEFTILMLRLCMRYNMRGMSWVRPMSGQLFMSWYSVLNGQLVVVCRGSWSRYGNAGGGNHYPPTGGMTTNKSGGYLCQLHGMRKTSHACANMCVKKAAICLCCAQPQLQCMNANGCPRRACPRVTPIPYRSWDNCHSSVFIS